MAATERVVVLMSPEEKAALDAKSTRSGRVSTAELVRRAVEAYDTDAARDAAELRGLLELLATTHEETLRRLAVSERKLDDTLAYLAQCGLAA